MKNSLVIILSACFTHQCRAFAASAFRASLASSYDVLTRHASRPRWTCCGNAPGGRHRQHQRRPRSLLWVAAEEGGGEAEGGDGVGDGNGGVAGAGAGMGLGGEWQVKSGEVSSSPSLDGHTRTCPCHNSMESFEQQWIL